MRGLHHRESYVYELNYSTLMFGLFLANYFNLLAISTSENPFRGSSLPKWAITFAVIFYTLKVFKSGMP